MSGLEDIRKRKLEELQRRAVIQENDEFEQLAQLEVAVKSSMTKEAVERYGNLKSAHPEKAANLLILLGQAIQRGQVNQINDDTLKEILIRLTPRKKEFRIRRK